MTSTSIRINFERAKSQARDLDEIASDLKRIADSQLEDAFNTVSSNWQCENATAYLKKGEKVQEDIRDAADDLKRAAASIRRIAETTYRAEMRALELARLRK